MGWGVQAILWIGRTVSAWPQATLAVPPLPALGLGVFSFGLAWLGLWRTRWRLLGLVPMLAGLLSPLVAPPPDLLVSTDARLIAWRAEGELLAAGAAGCLEIRARRVGQPSRRRAVPRARRRPTGGVRPDPVPARPAAAAARNREDGRLPGRRPAGLGRAGARRVPGAAGLLDRFTVWRDGAHAVWLEDGRAVVVSDRQYRGDRPWVPPPPTPRRPAPNLPMAPAEVLPED